VTITGTGFTGAIAITFGTAQATSYTVTGDTLITATSPPGAAGSVDITVTTPGGTSPVVTADWFTYMDNTPVPEFPAPAFPVMVLSALALLTILFRKAGQESP
jgi:hypothetical protein